MNSASTLSINKQKLLSSSSTTPPPTPITTVASSIPPVINNIISTTPASSTATTSSNYGGFGRLNKKSLSTFSYVFSKINQRIVQIVVNME